MPVFSRNNCNLANGSMDGENIKNFKTTLFSYAKNDENSTIELDDPEIKEYTRQYKLDAADERSEFEFLGYFYHSSDINTKKAMVFNKSEDKTRYDTNNLLCYLCGQAGHLENYCQRNFVPFCYICGQEGHYKCNCPQQICLKCFGCGHKIKDCKEMGNKQRFTVCNRCPGGQHSVIDCPNIWRRYEILKSTKKITFKGCPICLACNHFVDDCGHKSTKFSIFSSNFMEIANSSRRKK